MIKKRGGSFVYFSCAVFEFDTVVGDNINIMKKTFELNFNFYQGFKQQGYTKIWKQREAVNLNRFISLISDLLSYYSSRR